MPQQGAAQRDFPAADSPSEEQHDERFPLMKGSDSLGGSGSGEHKSPPRGQHGGFKSNHAQAMATLEIEESFLPARPYEFKHPFSVWQRRYITGLFTLLASLLFADQNLLAPNLSAAAAFFGFDDTEKDEKLGGYIGAAFFGVGAPAALLVGWYADHVNRRDLLFFVAVLGAAPCMATIFVTQYWQFFVLRVMTGISVGGSFPLLYSLLGDLFPSSQRALVSSFIQIATGAGVFVGQLLAAIIGPATDWRLPFVVVAAPSLLVSLLMLLTTKEPPRGACEEAIQTQRQEAGLDGAPMADYSEKVTWEKVRLLMKVPSNWLIFAQGFPGSLPWGMFIAFFNDYIQIKNGFDAKTATVIVTLFGIGNAAGVVGGGAMGQWLYNKRKEGMPLMAGLCVLLGIGPTLVLVNADLSKLFGLGAFMSLLAGVLASVAGPCVKAVTLNVNDPEARGVALAVQTMTDDLGKALGPFIVAGFIRRLGRTSAFNLAVCGWVPCGLLILGLVWCMVRDEAAMQARLMKTLEAIGRRGDNGLERGEGGAVRDTAPLLGGLAISSKSASSIVPRSHGNGKHHGPSATRHASLRDREEDGDEEEGEGASRAPLLPLSHGLSGHARGYARVAAREPAGPVAFGSRSHQTQQPRQQQQQQEEDGTKTGGRVQSQAEQWQGRPEDALSQHSGGGGRAAGAASAGQNQRQGKEWYKEGAHGQGQGQRPPGGAGGDGQDEGSDLLPFSAADLDAESAPVSAAAAGQLPPQQSRGGIQGIASPETPLGGPSSSRRGRQQHGGAGGRGAGAGGQGADDVFTLE